MIREQNGTVLASSGQFRYFDFETLNRQREFLPKMGLSYSDNSVLKEQETLFGFVEEEAKGSELYSFEADTSIPSGVIASVSAGASSVTATLAAGTVSALGGVNVSPFMQNEILYINNTTRAVVVAVNKPAGSSTHTLTLAPFDGQTPAQLATAIGTNATFFASGSIDTPNFIPSEGRMKTHRRYKGTFSNIISSTERSSNREDREWKQEVPYTDEQGNSVTGVIDMRDLELLVLHRSRAAHTYLFSDGRSWTAPDTYAVAEDRGKTFTTTMGVFEQVFTHGLDVQWNPNGDAAYQRGWLASLSTTCAVQQIGKAFRLRMHPNLRQQFVAAFEPMRTNVDVLYNLWGNGDGSNMAKMFGITAVGSSGLTLAIGESPEFMHKSEFATLNTGKWATTAIGINMEAQDYWPGEGEYYTKSVPQFMIRFKTGSRNGTGSGRYRRINLGNEHFGGREFQQSIVREEFGVQGVNVTKSLKIRAVVA